MHNEKAIRRGNKKKNTERGNGGKEETKVITFLETSHICR